MAKSTQIYLQHILNAISDIENHVFDMKYADFLKDVKTQDAVIRKMGIIGEAVKNIPNEFKQKHTETEWKEISNMRNILIHVYFNLDYEEIWKTIEVDIPLLKRQIIMILED